MPSTRISTSLSPEVIQTAIQQVQRSHENRTLTSGSMTRFRPPQSQSAQPEDSFILIDHSGSMGEGFSGKATKQQAANEAGVYLVLQKEVIDPHDRIGIIVFDDSADVLLDLSPIATHKKQMITTLQSIEVNGGTDLNAGLVAAEEYFDWNRKNVVRRIILLTDGHGGDPILTAQNLKHRGVVIDVVGIGPNPSSVNEKLLKQIASTIQGELLYKFIRNLQTLTTYYNDLGNKTATS
jgi:Mg-chelatase subunit ChlD